MSDRVTMDSNSFQGSEQGRFTDWLRDSCGPRWRGATRHRFTVELAEGTLPEEVFRQYLEQDYRFLEPLLDLFATALAEAPDRDAKARYAGFLATITGDENDYFERSMEALDLELPVDREIVPAPVTRRFENLIYRAAGRGGYATTLAVLVPVEWVYLSWAEATDPVDSLPFYYREWIDLHDNPEFRDFVSWMRGELDREGPLQPEDRRRTIRDLFQQTVSLERDFFDAAYEWGGAED